MSEIAIRNQGLFNAKEKHKPKTNRETTLLTEEREIVKALDDLRQELNILYNQFNFVTDPALIDGCIYDIKAANSKYTFYLNRCKEKQIKAV